MPFVNSADGTKLHYKISGNGDTALIFCHGWLGSGEWWNAQSEFLKDNYLIVQADLAGHGKSDKTRTSWTVSNYAEDIKAISNDVKAKQIILIGHSMSGAYVTEAFSRLQNVKALILVDTLKNLDQIFTPEQVETFLFKPYREDFKGAVENLLPQHLFSKDTPPEVRKRLQDEFLKNDPEFAIKVLEPLYKTDIRDAAKKVSVPVIALNSDYIPTNVEANRKYFRDYECLVIEKAGHYPMLERPESFNKALNLALARLSRPDVQVLHKAIKVRLRCYHKLAVELPLSIL